jgi:dTDP-4-dehydrorhamnose reductase
VRNTRVLILGGSGMLGHKVWQVFRGRFDTWLTLRSGFGAFARFALFDPGRTLPEVDAVNFDTILRAVATVHPDVVVNTIGIIKQRPEARDPVVSLGVNSLFPHRLALLCGSAGVRLIHISTDCVFSGRRGKYNETETPDAEDLYGRSKSLGEPQAAGSLTIRTSLIGHELKTAIGLVDWFMNNTERSVPGYVNAIFSGFPTIVFSEILADIIEKHPTLSGLSHISSNPISKFDLLRLIADAYGKNIDINPCPDVHVDRSLDSSRFRGATGFTPRPWPEMIGRMASDYAPYQAWRQADGS